ncbi:unnamed protein product [Hymenolepis diminuta]|uniref:STAS domain-containing protein n=1 Tax=Hymenolepis diminuta TaxID=6216 RepID=A0A158QC36_HYMDI|nr:unnamed protein product [Hymenolepis diminuta]
MVVGHIPSGLPAPVLPTFSYFSELIPDIFVIAIITFAINAGLVKTYATEFGYDILDNQELLAMGISNAFGAFFKCHTACGALGRTAVVVTIGMASQAVLGCIVCVALQSTFKKILDLKRLWKVSKIDASIWLVSFVTTLGIDIIYGVAVGFVYSILTVVSRSQYGGRFLLGEAKNTDLYSELKRFEELHELDNIKIIRYDGPVYFANIEAFRKSVYRLSGIDPVKIQRQQNKRSHECHIFPNVFKSRSAKNLEVPVEENDVKRFDDEEEVENIVKSRKIDSTDTDWEDSNKTSEKSLRYIILDASGWMFTDTVGLRGIKEMIKNYTELEITIFVTCLRPRLSEMFAASGVFAVLPEENFFMSVHDAVLVAKTELRLASEDGNQDPAVRTGTGHHMLGQLPRRESGGAVPRRRHTTDEVRSIMEADPDNTTDLSVLGEERAVVF